MAEGAPFRPLNTQSDLEEAFDASEQSPVVLYKHSNRCSLSAQARDEMQAFARDSEVPIYEVVVQEARPVSDAIEERLGIRHETPQVIALDKGKPVYDASHGTVSAESLRNQLAKAA